MDFVLFSFSAFTPFIYPPGMVSWMDARQNVLTEKMFSENSFWCKILWLIPHAPKQLGKRRGTSGE
jgi:hypothetical protein